MSTINKDIAKCYEKMSMSTNTVKKKNTGARKARLIGLIGKNMDMSPTNWGDSDEPMPLLPLLKPYDHVKAILMLRFEDFNTFLRSYHDECDFLLDR